MRGIGPMNEDGGVTLRNYVPFSGVLKPNAPSAYFASQNAASTANSSVLRSHEKNKKYLGGK